MNTDEVESIIPKTATDPSVAYRPALFYRSAREGMRDLIQHVLGSPQDQIALPGFIGFSPREGSGVFDPVRETGVGAGFYDLQEDLTVDITDLERLLSIGQFKIIVVIHYFGRAEPRLEKIRSLADDHGAILVEDLAHGFFTAQKQGSAGRTGHVNLFSLHKMLPMVDGGMVQYADSTLLAGQSQTRPDLAQAVLNYDWSAISAARRINYERILERLRGLSGLGSEFSLMWSGLADQDVPQTLPVRIHNSRRDDIYFGMNADGYGMVSLYHTLIPESRAHFPDLATLSEQIINFPVHQDLDGSEIDGMVMSFTRHLTGPAPIGAAGDRR